MSLRVMSVARSLSVARMEHSGMRERPLGRPGSPDFAALHPGCEDERQACSPSLSAAIQVRHWSCGIGMWVEPRKANALLTALEKQGTPPTLGLSPTPLAPIGWCGDGVVVQSVSHFGVSTAMGRK